jgi:CheY-like chemotaxis protein
LNLLINAAQSIDDGHATDNVITVRTWSEGDNVFAEVGDTGAGIAPENLERIFEPFFTTKGVGKGTGLGLSICQTLVTQLGGEIRVESEVGKGTRFVVRLPAKTKALASMMAPTIREKPAAPVRRGRILVVDDEELICRMLARVLGGDHDVITACSGKEARAILEGDQVFDVILCDLMMPDVTGMDLYASVTTRDPGLARRMLFMTGGAFTPKAEAFLNSIVTLKLDKPLDADEVRRVVGEMMVNRAKLVQ